MDKCRQIVDSRGRTWTVAKVSWKEAEEQDFRFWYEGLAPEERVEAVAEALEGVPEDARSECRPPTTKSSSPY